MTSNNFTKVPNKLMDVLMSNQLRPSDKSILACVIRHTSGYHKKTSTISLSEFGKYTGLSRKYINESLARLVSSRILVKHGNGRNKANSWEIQEEGIGDKLVAYGKLVSSRQLEVVSSRQPQEPHLKKELKKKEKKEKKEIENPGIVNFDDAPSELQEFWSGVFALDAEFQKGGR